MDTLNTLQCLMVHKLIVVINLIYFEELVEMPVEEFLYQFVFELVAENFVAAQKVVVENFVVAVKFDVEKIVAVDIEYLNQFLLFLMMLLVLQNNKVYKLKYNSK